MVGVDIGFGRRKYSFEFNVGTKFGYLLHRIAFVVFSLPGRWLNLDILSQWISLGNM
jgi:hypothetical protein